MKKLAYYNCILILILFPFFSCSDDTNEDIFLGKNKSFYEGTTNTNNNGNNGSNGNNGNNGNNPTNRYDCIDGNCFDNPTSGTFSSLAECESFCGSGNNACPSVYIDPRDNQTYKVVQIGEQCWFAENLNYATGNSWCYNDSSSNCNIYGRLYDWQTALTACPSGWHLPSDAEWRVLTDYLGGMDLAGGKMKSTSGWNNNTAASNSSGFSGFPGGYRNNVGNFLYAVSSGVWWSSTESFRNFAWHRQLNSNNNSALRSSSFKPSGLSCRCIKD